MYHLLVPGSAGLLNSLNSVGAANDPVTVHLSERDGMAFESAVRGKAEVGYLPYDPKRGKLLRTATVASVRYVWPAAEDEQ